MRNRTRIVFLIALAAAFCSGSVNAVAQMVTVDATPSHVVNKFSPLYALGSTVDRVPSNATDVFFRPDQVQKVLSAGWGMVSYRQNTDLFVQAWHWNPKGKWSDPGGKGYFDGDATPTKEMIRHSYGYQLRHRGFTRNGGTEFDGFSRLDDGDTESYWKSNPYLSKEFTGEDDSLHPQWVVVALDKKEDVNAIRIHWAEPYARDFEVQYWVGDGDAMDDQDKGAWKDFPQGSVTDGKGGIETLRMGSSAVSNEVRAHLMTHSSNTCDTHGSADRRNCVGYAIRELYLGTDDDRGEFQRPAAPFARPEADAHAVFVGRSVARACRICMSRRTAWNQAISRGSIYFLPAESRAACPPSFPSQCCTARRRTRPRRCRTSRSAAIPCVTWKWARSPTGNTCSLKITAHCTYSSRPRCIAWTPNFKLGGPVFEGVTGGH